MRRVAVVATLPSRHGRSSVSKRGLTDQERAFLRDNPFVGTATTLRADGSPHSTVVWIDEVDGDVLFNTFVGSAKERHLRRDRRASVLVVDPENMFKWVAVSGQVTLTTDGAESQLDTLSLKYLRKPVYPNRRPGQQRINAQIHVDNVDSTGFGD
jgi:PPOX class probable F420-dependent enzyme